MYTKFFEVYGCCERDIQHFMDSLQAFDRNIEPTQQKFVCSELVPIESKYIGFGYAKTTYKHLKRLADFHSLQLAFAQSALYD